MAAHVAGGLLWELLSENTSAGVGRILGVVLRLWAMEPKSWPKAAGGRVQFCARIRIAYIVLVRLA